MALTDVITIPPEERNRETGIPAVGAVPWGTHLCYFYDTKQDLIDILVPYFKAGLENNEFCIWVTSEYLDEKEAEEAIGKAVPDFAQYLERGQIEIIPHTEWYLKDGVFNGQRVINAWIGKLERALANDYDGMRVTGDTDWVGKRYWRKFTDYEKQMHNIIGEKRMIALCTYSLGRCGASGVIDVVSKHQFALTTQAGDWSLTRSSERKRAEEELRQSEEKYRGLFELAPIGITTLDMKGVITACNPAVYGEGGYTADDLVGKHFSKIAWIGVKNIPKYIKTFNSIIRGKVPAPFEVAYTRKDGTPGWTEVHVSLLRDGRKKLGILVLQSDITARKLAEEEIARFKKVADIANYGVCICDLKRTLIYVNECYAQMHGYAVDELIGQQFPIVYPEWEWDHALQMFNQLKKRGEIKNEEVWHKRKDGSVFPSLMNSTALRDDTGKPYLLFAITVDISDRKQAEEEIRRLAKFPSENPNPVLRVAKDGTILYANEASLPLLSVWGCQIGQVLPDHLCQSILEVLGSASPKYIEVECGGQTFSFMFAPIVDADYVNLYGRDITERKQAEEAIWRSEERYRSLFDNMLNGFAYCKIIVDENNKPVDFVYLEINDAFERLTGLKREDVIGRKVTEAIPGTRELNPELFTIYGKVALTGEPTQFDIYFQPLRIWLAISVYSPQKDYFVAVFENITERKQAEDKLRTSEENFRNSLDASPLGVRIVSADGELLYANKAILDIYGYSSIEELKATPVKERYTPESYAKRRQRIKKRKRGEYVAPDYEISIIRQDGEIRHLAVFRKEVIWNGEPQFQTLYQDITEQKQAEEALRESEEKYRGLIEDSHVGIAVSDLEGKFTFVNQALCEMTGYSREEFLGRYFIDFIHPEDREEILGMFREGAAAPNGVIDLEFRIIHKKGYVVHMTASPLPLKEGDKPAGVIALITDITQLKRQEELIHELAEVTKERTEIDSESASSVAEERPLTPLQERFVKSGLEDFDDREAVELLTSICPRGRKEASTKHCFKNFNNIREIMSVSQEDLEQAGFAPQCIFYIKLLREIPREVLRERIRERAVYESSKEVFDYLYFSMRDLKEEVFKVIYLNSREGVIDIVDLFEGEAGSIYIPPREVVETAIKRKAASLLFIHNHPSGDPKPGKLDRRFTRDLVFVGNILQIRVLDHIIIGEDRYFSFADEGLIKQYEDDFLNVRIRRI